MSSDLVERVAIAISGAPFATEKSRKKARAAIAIALEEAAKVLDKRAAELSILRDGAPHAILRDGAPHVSAAGRLSWSDYNSRCIEVRSLAITLCKLALEMKHD